MDFNDAPPTDPVVETATITEVTDTEAAAAVSGNSKAPTPGQVRSPSQAGPARKFKFRSRGSSQSNTMLNYMKVEPAKRSRGDRDVDSSDEDGDEENKSMKLYTSPTKQEMESYAKLARVLHKQGRLSADQAKEARRILSQERATEYNKLLNLAVKEKAYYRDLRKQVLMGNNLPATSDFKLDVAMFEATKKKIAGNILKLGDLEDVDTKAVDYSSPDTSLDTSYGSCVFTEDEE